MFVPAITTNPTAAWVTQQARNFALHLEETGQEATLLLRDHDSKYTASFDSVIEAEGAKVKPVGPLAPNMNAHAERFVQTVKQECLDHFLFFGEPHWRRVWVELYNMERPHQGVGNVPLGEEPEPEPVALESFRLEDVLCEERLGGLIRHCRRAA